MLQKDTYKFNKCPNMYSVCRYYSRQHPKDYDIIGKHFYFFYFTSANEKRFKIPYTSYFWAEQKITSQHFSIIITYANYGPFFLVILYPSICNNRAQQLIIRFNIIASGAVRSILLLTR
jgi:hypothetical protein